MDNGIYTALAGQVGNFHNMNNVANNIANANTTGYKSDYMLFNRYLTQDVQDKNTMPQDYSTVSDYKNGPLKITNNPLDLAITGQGLFMVQTPMGIRYTRNGHFIRNNENLLVNMENHPILSQEGNPIELQENDNSVIVYQNGALYAKGDEDREYQERGVIGVMNFDNPQLLRKAGNNLMMSDIDGYLSNDFTITQGALEESNVENIMEVTRMIELQRKSEMTTSLIEGIYNVHKTAYKAISKQGN